MQSGSLVYTQTILLVFPPGRKIVSDANYAAFAADISVGLAPLTASRTITLPPLATMASAKTFPIGDKSGSASSTIQIDIGRAGQDLHICVAGTQLTIETPYQYLAPRAGASTWSLV